MNFADIFMSGYESLLYFIAEITVYTLELIGILIIIIGSFKAIFQLFSKLKNKRKTNIIIDLGKMLALALEFKMGAEIVNTVIVRNLAELGTLAIVIALRAILSILIHWEIKNERKAEMNEPLEEKEKEQGSSAKEKE
jgi:uncharacterized membrane protein